MFALPESLIRLSVFSGFCGDAAAGVSSRGETDGRGGLSDPPVKGLSSDGDGDAGVSSGCCSCCCGFVGGLSIAGGLLAAGEKGSPRICTSPREYSASPTENASPTVAAIRARPILILVPRGQASIAVPTAR